jgi:hypothetical protein
MIMNAGIPDVVLTVAACLFAVGPARAGAAQGPAAADPAATYRQECGACHVAFAPRLLPPASWNALTANLPQHFGTDASVDPVIQKRLADWLASQGAAGRARPQGDRITLSPWFRHEHSELPAGVWFRQSVKSASNCGACHQGADSGVFDEHDVRIPR